jgi:hypothetical protein
MAVDPAIELPAPTAWPLIVAFGVTLTAAGLVTSAAVGMLGLLCAGVGLVRWFRDVFPHEASVLVEAIEEPPPIITAHPGVARLHLAPELQRARLPLEIYPVSAGIKGGFAGSLVMAVLAMIYGLLSGTSIWYPINLLAAGFIPNAVHTATTSELTAFHLRLSLIAVPIHAITSLLVGLLYGAVLPMMPRRPMLLGGLIAPLFWSGVLYGTLNIVNPLLYRRIDWPWFVLSQIGFGLAAGAIVSRQERIRTWQAVPLALRIGMESPGLVAANREEERR